jgi:hypothetical protein
MARLTFQIKIRGPQPDEVSARFLADTLIQLENSLAAVARENGVKPEAGPLLSLVGIGEGSDLLTFSTPELGLPVVAVLSKAIASQNYGPLPSEAHEALWKASEKILDAGWSLEFLEDKRGGIVPSRVTKEEKVPPPPKPVEISGKTSILARCLRVGGATKPKAELRVVQGGALLHVGVSETIAKALGRHLYEEAILHGRARWNSKTQELVEFEIERVEEFARTDPQAAFDELARSAGTAWDDIDAEEFVRSIRGE